MAMNRRALMQDARMAPKYDSPSISTDNRLARSTRQQFRPGCSSDAKAADAGDAGGC